MDEASMKNESNPTKLILLNGPPHVGKSTAAKLIVKRSTQACQIISPAWILRRTASALFALTPSDVAELDTPMRKNIADVRLLGLSYREVLIWLSEDVLKRRFGRDVIARLFVRDIMSRNSACRLFIVDNVGFTDEAEFYLRHFGAPNVLLLKITRPGHSAFDSREDIDERNFPHVARIDNTFEMDLFEEQIVSRINVWHNVMSL